jgi:hypothetical protein
VRSLSARGTRLLAVGTVAGVAAAHVAAGVFFASHDPYATQILPPCPVLQLTGWQCPGCGSTRALYSLLHGDVAKAFAMNPLLLASYASALLLVAMAVAERTRHLRLGRALSTAAIAIVIAAVVYTGLVRNLV